MGTTTHSIDVKAPLRPVYDQWTQFEEFPRFMRDVVEVRQHGPDALSWKVLMGGKEKRWEARIVEQIPDTSIVWESVDGTANRGAITFEPLGPDATRLTLVMEYEPEGFLEKAGDLLGVPSGHVAESLNSFRDLIESKSNATGGWRGRIESSDQEKASVKTHTTDSVPHRSLQAIPVTDREAGEHEAGMVARVSDKEEVRKEEPLDIASNELAPVTSGADAAESLCCRTFFEPHKEDIARRAYDLSLARGQVAGHEVDDWLEAERQLMEESNSKI
jgi:hypothetical protein